MISFIVCICLFFVFTKASFQSNSTDCSYFLSPTGIDEKNSTDFASLSFALKQFIVNKPNETDAKICLKKGVFKKPKSFDLTFEKNFTISQIKTLEIKSVDGIAEIDSDILISPGITLNVDFQVITFDSLVIGEAASVVVQSRQLIMNSCQSHGTVSLSTELLSMSDVLATSTLGFSISPFAGSGMTGVTIENSTFNTHLDLSMRGNNTVVQIETTSFNAGIAIGTLSSCHPSTIVLHNVNIVVPVSAPALLSGDCVRDIRLSNVHISSSGEDARLQLLADYVVLMNVTTIKELRFQAPSGARKSMMIEDSDLNFLPLESFIKGFSAPQFVMSDTKITCNGGYMPFQCAVPPDLGRYHPLDSCINIDPATQHNITACRSVACGRNDQYPTENGLSCVTCKWPKKVNFDRNQCILPEPCSATNNSPDCVDCKDGYFNTKTYTCASCAPGLDTTPTGCGCSDGYYLDGTSCTQCRVFDIAASLDGRCELLTILPWLIFAGVFCWFGCMLLFLICVVMRRQQRKRKKDSEMNEPLLREED